MKIILATDAWEPQINGVARTLKKTIEILENKHHEVHVLCPDIKKSFRCPFTKDVRLSSVDKKQLQSLIKKPCAIHIATEGPIGLQTRKYCIKNKLKFTTAYHTKFPEFVNYYTHIPVSWTRKYINWFHNASSTVMVATNQLGNEIKKNGISTQIKLWQRGVDFDLFHPRSKTELYEKPVALFVGRVSKEKNLDAFLGMQLDIQKIVVGDGPELVRYKAVYKDAIFKGALYGEELAQAYCNSDVFVFPSLADTFGLVVIESLACGVPVACYPVQGPGEIIDGQKGIGCSSWSLEHAVLTSLKEKDAATCTKFAQNFSWEKCTEQFLDNLVLD